MERWSSSLEESEESLRTITRRVIDMLQLLESSTGIGYGTVQFLVRKGAKVSEV